ncbi:mycothiol-dependent nitroreductase Rv2466c family protein [Nocardia barduliensis]|uniref:mycothiol-dependent nitroreductase Rv2466c family protein n=1 Tax=Nocardia barduliensis TaxID=2736643 RepID=UPI003F68AC72
MIGSPIISVDGHAFSGPVLTEPPRPGRATELLAAIITAATTPGFAARRAGGARAMTTTTARTGHPYEVSVARVSGARKVAFVPWFGLPGRKSPLAVVAGSPPANHIPAQDPGSSTILVALSIPPSIRGSGSNRRKINGYGVAVADRR